MDDSDHITKSLSKTNLYYTGNTRKRQWHFGGREGFSAIFLIFLFVASDFWADCPLGGSLAGRRGAVGVVFCGFALVLLHPELRCSRLNIKGARAESYLVFAVLLSSPRSP